MVDQTSEPVSIGGVRVLAVQDAPISGSRSFMYPDVPDDRWDVWRRDFPQYFNPRGNVTLNIGTFVIRSGGLVALVDTGTGPEPRGGYPAGNMLANMAEAGVRPEDVSIVISSHLHGDHVGWNTIERDGAWVTTFPNARYIVARTEWEYWSDPQRAEGNETIQESVLPLEGSGQLELVDSNYAVTEELTLVPAPGHTPGHVCIAIVSGGEHAMIVGDLAHHPVQLTETAWEMAFDLDKAAARHTREQIVERMERENAVALGGHFPPPGFGRLVQLNGRAVWRALGP